MPKEAELLRQAEMLEGVLWDTHFSLIWRAFHDDVSPKLHYVTIVITVFCRNLQTWAIDRLHKEGPAKLESLQKFLGNKKWILGDKVKNNY